MLIQSPKNQKLFKSFLVGHDQKMGVANLIPGTNSCKLKDIWKFLGWAWPKKGLASVVTGIWNWLYVKNELMEWILHVDTDSQIKTNQNFFGWAWSKIGVWSRDSTINCISKMSRWHWLVSCPLTFKCWRSTVAVLLAFYLFCAEGFCIKADFLHKLDVMKSIQSVKSGFSICSQLEAHILHPLEALQKS